MKSFISEEKTVLKAIEKAMLLAEKPSVFTVKILEAGVQSIFWWQNKAAVILFSYELPAVDESSDPKKNKKQQNTELPLKKNFKNNGVALREDNQFLENRYYQKASVSVPFEHKEKTSTGKRKAEVRSNPFQENNSKDDHAKSLRKEAIVSSGIKNNYFEKKTQCQEKEKQLSEAQKSVVMVESSPLLSSEGSGQVSSLKDTQKIKAKTAKKKHKEMQNDEAAVSAIPLANPSCGSDKILSRQNIQDDVLVKNQEVLSQGTKIEKIEQWTPDQVLFVSQLIESLNKDHLFSVLPIKVFLEDTLLVVLIEGLHEVQGIEKKHLFSSLVVMIYEHLKMRFREFESRNYRLVVR